MQINVTNYSGPVSGSGRRPAQPVTNVQDAAIFTERDALAQKLSQAAGARSESIARAKALILNSNYPPDVTIRGIANLLATNFYPEGE